MIKTKKIISLYRKRYCPKCTKVIRKEFDDADYSDNPIFLIKRINKKTNDYFYGCPNFPKCKYTEKRPPTRRERDIKIWAWANSIGGYY